MTISAALSIGNVPGVNGTAALEGRVNLTDGTILVETNDNNGNAFIAVGRDGTGTFNATDSAVTIQAEDNSAILFLGGTGTSGSLVNSQGTATFDNRTIVINSDSTGTGSAVLNVGRNGNGGTNTLNVNNGSTITLSNDAASSGSESLTVGRNNTTGIMNIDASTVTSGDFVSVGRNGGTGTLSVTNGGSVDNNNLVGLTRIGRGGGTGTLNVTGTSSLFSSKNLEIGRDALSTGTVNVNTGGTLDVADTIQVGRDSNTANSLTIGAGGVVNAHTTIIGHNTGSNGATSVSGPGAQFNLSGLAPIGGVNQDGAVLLVGRNGTGTLDVNTGGVITVSPGTPVGAGLSGGMLIGGSSSNPTGTGVGTVNVDGFGSSIVFSNVNGAAGNTQIGRDGTGTLNITNGASVSGATQNLAVVGRKVGGTGTVNVTGPGSTWTTSSLFVGTDVNFGTVTASGPGGTGTLNVANGGAVFANDIVNGATGSIIGGGGTIYANIQNSGTIGPGNSPGLLSVVGDVDLLAGSTLAIEVGGLVFDTGYDRLDVNGTTNIAAGSIFDIDFFGGFGAALGDSFDVLVANDIIGDLNTATFDFTGALLGAGFGWSAELFTFTGGANDGREALRLTVVSDAGAVPEPSSMLVFGFGMVGLWWFRRQRKIA